MASPIFDQNLQDFSSLVSQQGLGISRGIEKEGLRADKSLNIAQSDHPHALGHPLTHPAITTDYSEALLELITPVENSRDELISKLENVHAFVQSHLGEEILWSGSMPCRLEGDESIRIAEYGDSNIGQLKHVYRQGLAVRYGRIMQSIAGLHFNFSLDDSFWSQWQRSKQDASSLQEFKSEQYFALIRNFRRLSWLLMYLFGASPVTDKSFLEGMSHDLDAFDDKGSYFKPYATSLRMGDLGYHNNAQASLNICFNRLENFTHTLQQAIKTPYGPYEEIGIQRDGQYIQINSNILQIENEYYSPIRPKRTANSGESPTHALMERGVEYVEVRCLDLDPFMELGIMPQNVDFLDLFLIYCLLYDSPLIQDEECNTIDENFKKTVNEGRRPGLALTRMGDEISLKDWGLEIIQQLGPIADLLDSKQNDGRYRKALFEQEQKLHRPELTPSARILEVMRGEQLSWLEFVGQLSHKHKVILTEKLQQGTIQNQSRQVEQSFIDSEATKASDTISFDNFIKTYQNG